MVSAFHQFVADTKVHILLLVIAVDLAVGVLAAIKAKTFKLDYIGQFLKDDVAFKVIPYFFFYFGSLIAGNQNAVVIPGLDMSIIAGGIYALVMAQMVASIIGSLKELGIAPATLPKELT